MRTLLATLAILFGFAAGACAQHVDAGIDITKAFSIIDGRFVYATVPSVTFLQGPFEVNTSSYFSGTRFFEQDTRLTMYQRENAKRRWSLFASVAHFKWPGGQDINGQAGLRWRLR